MLSRVLSALVLVPAVLGLLFFSPPSILLVALGMIGSVCLWEYFQLTEKMGLSGQSWFGYAGLWGLFLGLHREFLPATALVALLSLSSLLAWLGRRVPMKQRVSGAMVDAVAVLYIGLSLYTAFLLRYDFGERPGLQWFVILLAVIWIGDVAALFVGRGMGRRRLAPAISPNKTIEGALGGLLAGTLAAVGLRQYVYTDLPLVHVVAASLLVNVAGQLGDLAESMLKRAADVKDSSQLIPGHGGVLDRLDSLLFAFPVMYCYLARFYAH